MSNRPKGCLWCSFDDGPSERPQCEACDWADHENPTGFMPKITQQAARALLAACKGMVAEDMELARMTIEDGPGGTDAELAAVKLIIEREKAVLAAIANAKGTDDA